MELVKVIITAMKEEADIIIDRLKLEEKEVKNTMKIYEWSRQTDEWEEKLVLILSWIWKVQAALATTYAFENYDVNKLVNVWIAWNLNNSDIKVWDVFLPNTFIQHDMYLPLEWEEYDYANKPLFLNYAIWDSYDLNKFWLILSWICLTWDQFIDDKNKILELNEKYWADVCEMEAFSILSVANEYWKLDKCVVIKAVSDWADSDALGDFKQNLDFAMKNSVDVLELIL